MNHLYKTHFYNPGIVYILVKMWPSVPGFVFAYLNIHGFEGVFASALF